MSGMSAKPILQSSLAILPWMDVMTSRLPGVQPCPPGEWLMRDDAFAAQMKRREELVETQREDVFICPPEAEAAGRETLLAVLEVIEADPDYSRAGPLVTRPDGGVVDLSAHPPLLAAGLLVQEDLVLLAPSPDGHVFAAGLVCFPASWTFPQKIGRHLTSIHEPVARYDPRIAMGVERIISNLRPREPVWRANVLPYNDPELHQPRREGEKKPFDEQLPTFVRVERQTLLRTSPRNVVFAIHTCLVPLESLTADAAQALRGSHHWPK
jgi:hypothetical protein